MKKVIFALLGAAAMASIPLNVKALDDCEIVVNSGETKTINYDTKGCRVTNKGTLNVVSGANISKYTQDNHAAIDNYGTLNIRGGNIYADYGYAVTNYSGNVNVSGGTIHSILHQAIWAKSGTTTNINGGTLKGAIGGEEVVYSKGNLSICGGNFNSTRSNQGNEAETASCPKPAEAEKVTITVTASIKDAPAKQEKVATTNTNTTPAKTTTPSAAKTAENQATEEVKAEAKTEVKSDKKVEEKKAGEKTEQQTESTEEETKDENNNIFVIAIAGIIAVFGAATAAIIISHVRH